jgi:Asp-tRNA(Asn)/Glu-tRNA(Gln) amidotransferase A subunit family amidase
LPASLAGVPAMSLPSNLTAPSLPIGMQLIAPWFSEMSLLSAADHCFQSLGGAHGSL